jgi:acyl-CoA hydrolase
MINHKLVLPEHLNHYGYLFGGNLLKWVDEYAWIAATLEYPGCNFVTMAMDRVEFRRSIQEGAVLRFEINKDRAGTTSVHYAVTVFARNIHTGGEEAVFSTHVTLVRVDNSGRKIPLPPPSGI